MTSADVQIADRYPGARGIRQLRNDLDLADGGAASIWVGPNGKSASSMTAKNIGQTRTAEDIERLEYLAAQGWIIVRVGARQLRYDRAEILAHVRRALVQYL